MITVGKILDEKPFLGIIRVAPTVMVIEALEVMKNHNIGAVLVMDGTDLVGIFSERDYARKGILAGRKAKTTPISEVMTPGVFTVTPSNTIEECMALFREKRIRHLPVKDENGMTVGMLSIGDIVSAMIVAQRTHINFLEQYIGRA